MCQRGNAMSDERDVFNIRGDRAHDGKPEHIDMTVKLPEIAGADKVAVDFEGNVIGGSTQVGKTKGTW